MIKTLRPIGNSYGLIIDKSILAVLGIDLETRLDLSISQDGKGLVIRPVEVEATTSHHKARLREAITRTAKNHHATLKKLAE